MAKPRTAWLDALSDAAIRAVLRLALCIPYRLRVPLVGWIAARVAAPLAGWDRRIAANLARIRPDLPPDEVRRIQRAVPDNLGRSLIEIYSGEEFLARMRQTPLSGPGLAPFLAAREAGRPVVLVTGHIGNFDAPRGALFAQGHPLAGLYRPMHNPRFNAHYVAALGTIGSPVFPTTRKGILAFVRHLAEGGIAGILVDVYTSRGAPLTFFGTAAPTALSAAQWALRHDALVVPIFGLRQPDGLSFEVRLEAPVPAGSPEAMTQALNDAIEAQARAHMGQYLWIHDRWERPPGSRRKKAKAGAAEGPSEAGGAPQRRRAAARTGP